MIANKKANDAAFSGKELQNALVGGKIDLLRASKETCRKGAEREQCGQLRRAVSDCDILGSIQLASNMQRAVARCDEISGIMDQVEKKGGIFALNNDCSLAESHWIK